MEHVKLPELIIFDWAGTLVDFGCCAPLAAFCRAFENAGLPISDETARGPMGSHKRDHVREILHYPEVAERVRRQVRLGWWMGEAGGGRQRGRRKPR